MNSNTEPMEVKPLSMVDWWQHDTIDLGSGWCLECAKPKSIAYQSMSAYYWAVSEYCRLAPPVKQYQHPYVDDFDDESLPDLDCNENNNENQGANDNNNSYYVIKSDYTTSSSTSDCDTSTITEATPLPSSSDEPLIIKPKQCQII